jgi:hypothetical protein
MLARLGVLAHECKASTRKRRVGKLPIGRPRLAAAMLISVLGVAYLAAQERPRIRVAPTIIASAESQAALRIEIGPPDAVPPRSFLSLRGLPPTVEVMDAHAISPGSWAVPLAGLPALKALIPAGVSGEAEITIQLIAIDGRLLAQARTTLVIQRSSVGAIPQNAEPVGPPATVPSGEASSPLKHIERPSPTGPEPAPNKPALAAKDRQRALALFAKGEELFAAGNVGAARLVYERAADAGLAEAALALAATFDPEELGRRRVVGGVQPDRTAARRWYERARALGAREAEDRLTRLGARDR